MFIYNERTSFRPPPSGPFLGYYASLGGSLEKNYATNNTLFTDITNISLTAPDLKLPPRTAVYAGLERRLAVGDRFLVGLGLDAEVFKDRSIPFTYTSSDGYTAFPFTASTKNIYNAWISLVYQDTLVYGILGASRVNVTMGSDNFIQDPGNFNAGSVWVNEIVHGVLYGAGVERVLSPNARGFLELTETKYARASGKGKPSLAFNTGTYATNLSNLTLTAGIRYKLN